MAPASAGAIFSIKSYPHNMLEPHIMRDFLKNERYSSFDF